MTTIAIRNNMMAVDSQGTTSFVADPFPTTKIHKLHDGSLAATCGSAAQAKSVLNWLMRGADSGEDQPFVPEGGVVHFTRDGEIRVYEQGSYFVQEGEFSAFGSGRAIALAAMMKGATATEAVEIACVLDIYSGGPVVTMGIQPRQGELAL